MILLWITVACIALNAVMAYLFHNSRYPNGKKLTLPLAAWLLWILAILVPAVNVIFTVVAIIYMAIEYSEDTWIIQEESWLGKRY